MRTSPQLRRLFSRLKDLRYYDTDQYGFSFPEESDHPSEDPDFVRIQYVTIPGEAEEELEAETDEEIEESEELFEDFWFCDKDSTPPSPSLLVPNKPFPSPNLRNDEEGGRKEIDLFGFLQETIIILDTPGEEGEDLSPSDFIEEIEEDNEDNGYNTPSLGDLSPVSLPFSPPINGRGEGEEEGGEGEEGEDFSQNDFMEDQNITPFRKGRRRKTRSMRRKQGSKFEGFFKLF